ncbi:MAG: LytR C-terminal domain-containing protein, partial [Aeromicrobium sp.]
CLAAAVFYVVLLIGGDDTKPVAKPTATAKTSAPTTTAPTTPAPTTTTTTPPPVKRDIPVAVFNNTTTPGLARQVAAKVTAAGWKVSATGNWRGSVPETTVYYPPGFQAQAETLAKDLDFGRVKPMVSPMRAGRLTLILSGPQ